MHSTKIGSTVLAAAVLAGLAGLASAATVTNTYSGASPGDYNIAGSWSQGRVPGTNGTDVDNAVISGKSVSLDDDVNVAATNPNSLSINSGGTFTLNTGGSLTTANGATWQDGWIKVGATGDGHLVVNGGALNAKEIDFSHNSTFTMDGGTVTVRGRTTYLGNSSGGNFTANLNGGIINFNPTYSFVVASGGSTATITQNGATTYASGNPGSYTAETVIGQSGNGTWNLQSGEFYAGMVEIGNYTGGTGTMNQTGGHAHLTSDVNIGGAHQAGTGGGNGTYIISAGTLDTPATSPNGVKFGYGDGLRSFRIGTYDGTGLFKIIGNDATINLNQYAKSTYTLLTLGGNGTIEFDIDDATVSTIHVAGVGAAANTVQNASLGGVIDLNLINSYMPIQGATYDLLSATGTITDNGYTLAAGDATDWSLAIIGTAGSGQILRATYIAVPEPGSVMVLMSLGGLALMKRRRPRVGV